MNRIPRRQFTKNTSLATLGAFALPSCMTVPNAEAAQPGVRKPNILFIMADDLGYGDLGCYGQRSIQTPEIDRIAVEGMRFTQCYAGSTVCAPSRCCLMTGFHTGHGRVRGNRRVPLLPENETVAETLHPAGYITGIFGKWGLGEPDTTGIPSKQGFDEWFGYLNQKNAHNYYPEYLWNNEDKFPLHHQYSHDLFTRKALNFITRHQRRPFFLYLPYTIPHANDEKGKRGMEVPSDAPYTNKAWPQQEKNFAAMITRMDRDIGNIVRLLQQLGLDRDTILFFTSDNGPHKEGGHDPNFFDSNGPLRGIKRDLYEGGIRVPMIVRWPGKIKPGTVSDQVWAFWDFLPTAAELAGVPSPEGIDGMSMLPALLGKPQANHKYLYWEFHERGFTQAIRMGEWKGVRFGSDKPLELYNLNVDIGETNNVAQEHSDIVAEMDTILTTARTENQYWPTRGKGS